MNRRELKLWKSPSVSPLKSQVKDRQVDAGFEAISNKRKKRLTNSPVCEWVYFMECCIRRAADEKF